MASERGHGPGPGVGGGLPSNALDWKTGVGADPLKLSTYQNQNALAGRVSSEDIVRAFRQLTKEGVSFSGHAPSLNAELTSSPRMKDSKLGARTTTL